MWFLKNHESVYISRLHRFDSIETILTNRITPNDLEKVIRGIYLSNTLNLYTSTDEEMKNTERLYKLVSHTLLDKIETYYRLSAKESYYEISKLEYLIKNSKLL